MKMVLWFEEALFEVCSGLYRGIHVPRQLFRFVCICCFSYPHFKWMSHLRRGSCLVVAILCILRLSDQISIHSLCLDFAPRPSRQQFICTFLQQRVHNHMKNEAHGWGSAVCERFHMWDLNWFVDVPSKIRACSIGHSESVDSS